MTTIAWTRGETREVGFVPLDAAGQPVAAAFGAAELRLRLGKGVVATLPGSLRTLESGGAAVPGWGFMLDAAALGGLPSAQMSAEFWVQHAAGWLCLDVVLLRIDVTAPTQARPTSGTRLCRAQFVAPAPPALPTPLPQGRAGQLLAYDGRGGVAAVDPVAGGAAPISAAPGNTLDYRGDGLFAAPKLSSAQW